MESIRQNYSHNLSEDSSDSPPLRSYLRISAKDSKHNPRVGHEYQVEAIPSILNQSERLQLVMNPAVPEVGHDSSNSFATGLPVPITWVLNEADNSGHKGRGYLGDNGEEFNPNTLQSAMIEVRNSDQLGPSKKYILVPGTSFNSWSDTDAKNFLLGLYIFGKHFTQIKKFMENKEIGEIQTFYYGKFYKSNEYSRWSAFKNAKGRKMAKQLLTVRRQRLLMTRLISHVSDESDKRILQQAYKLFIAGCKAASKATAKVVARSIAESTLEKFVSSLKSTVGLGALVEIVGIGNEKIDLSTIALERKRRVFPAKTSQAWSSLESDGIINLLTGRLRLSKAKSNDLFWEAVWPRLLARGWHSEKLPNQGYGSSKNDLVFLVPGIKKFSRTKLVKGDQYFDSVSDILSKVVAEPNLLSPGEEAEPNLLDPGEEAEPKLLGPGEEGVVGSSDDEKPERVLNEDDEPQTSTCHTDDIKLTIVDTSLVVQGGKAFELRELKSAPVNLVGEVEVNEANDISLKRGKNVGGNKHTSGNIKQKLTDTSMPEGKPLKKKKLKDLSAKVEDAVKMTGVSRKSKTISCDDSSVVATTNMLIDDKKNISDTDDKFNAKEIVENLKALMPKDIQQKMAMERSTPDHSNDSVLPTKSKTLTASVKAEKVAPSRKTAGDSVNRQKSAVSIPSTKKSGQNVKAMAAEDGHRLKTKGKVLLSDILAAEVEKPNRDSKSQSGRSQSLRIRASESLPDEDLHGPKRQKR